MSKSRVTSEIWVSALRKRLEPKAIPIFIIKKGNKQAGAIIIRVSNLCGRSKIFVQAPNSDNERRWMELSNGSDAEMEEVLKNQQKFDEDAWILEVEELYGIQFFDEFLLEK